MTRRRRQGLARYFATGWEREVPHKAGGCEWCDEVAEIMAARLADEPGLADTYRRLRMRQAMRGGLPKVPVKRAR